MLKDEARGSWRGLARALLVLSGLAVCGCTLCQDICDGYKYRFTKPDTLVVLDKSNNGVEKAWTAVSKSESSLRDLIDAVPAVPDPKLRAAFYSKLQPLLNDKNENLRRSYLSARAVR